MAFGGGVESARFGLQLQAMGRIEESSATYKDGSLRRGRLVGSFAPARWLRLSLSTDVYEGPGWSALGAIGTRL
jgi:hypothetical protein